MKKLILLAAAVTFAFAANAKVWRINYDENANADFKTITAACSSAKVANTDTLYCEPGNHAGSAGDNVISRKGMKVFGPGWGFEPNYGGTSTIADARFSARVRVTANNVYVSGIVGDGELEIATKRNVTLDRCKISAVNAYSIDTLNGVTIKNCYLGKIYFQGRQGNNHKELKNIYITNNIFESRKLYGHYQAIDLGYNISKQNVSNVNILRNTIVFIPYWDGSRLILVYNSLIQDNIIISPREPEMVIDFATDRGNIIRKNVFSMSDGVANTDIIANFPDNYYVSATEANTFTCTQSTYRTEQYFQLKDGSPAKNAAYDGGDCGAFGGSTPYIICGRPQGIPYITDVEVPAQPKDNKLTVTFKVANQNE